MRLFRPLYEHALRWSKSPRAPWYLALLSFVEAFIFPVPPEVMLAPLTLSRPRRWAALATFSLVFSLLGSLIGYALGHWVYESLRPLLSAHMQATIA
ncbi:MAG: DedA family protein, partial [Xanthomonadales bacterium]|nr:DedA family protein [Xanthomonadales bacterium]